MIGTGDARSKCDDWLVTGVKHYSCMQYGGLMVSVHRFQVLYSLQGPVLWLGGRRSLQTGGREHQVSVFKKSTNLSCMVTEFHLALSVLAS